MSRFIWPALTDPMRCPLCKIAARGWTEISHRRGKRMRVRRCPACAALVAVAPLGRVVADEHGIPRLEVLGFCVLQTV